MVSNTRAPHANQIKLNFKGDKVHRFGGLGLVFSEKLLVF